MLCISSNSYPCQIAWYVGERLPIRQYPHEDFQKIFEIYADGIELDFILNAFNNIPRPNGDVSHCRWYGDHAKFIAGNL